MLLKVVLIKMAGISVGKRTGTQIDETWQSPGICSSLIFDKNANTEGNSTEKGQSIQHVVL
jgi:hypothetical protein